MDIDLLLQPFQRFGVNLGLDRIQHLLADLGNPHHQVPIIHVAGTNGKGSVCAYLASILTVAGYRVGRYTSPHLVTWRERICLDKQPITNEALAELLRRIQAAINPDRESPTQFEVITAAAWLYFAEQGVDVAVMEVGLGGRLDATNVVERPLVSVIVSLSLEHQKHLGATLAAIAGEKAGILKANCPAAIGPLPPEARAVVAAKVKELNCPVTWVEPAVKLPQVGWAKYREIAYPLPLLGEVQLTNSAVAIAAIQVLQKQGWQIPTQAIQEGIAQTSWLGRLQWTNWQGHRILIDGAHNPAAATALRDYIDSCDRSITWVIGMLSSKDCRQILTNLLRPGDSLYLVPVPDHSTAQPEQLATLARQICPDLAVCQVDSDVFTALAQAVLGNNLVVLSGSLYLIGYFLGHQMD